VTSTAETIRIADPRRRTGAGLLGILCLILLGELLTPQGPWAMLWPIVPVLGAATLLLSQTQVPAIGWLVPALTLAGLAIFGWTSEPWGWCLAAGSMAAAMLGFADRERTPAERRAWAYLPVLALAALFPLAPNYADFVAAVAGKLHAEEARQLAVLDTTTMAAEQKVAAAQLVGSGIQFGLVLAQNILPVFLFVWVALLVHLAERMARRLAELVKRPLPEPLAFEHRSKLLLCGPLVVGDHLGNARGLPAFRPILAAADIEQDVSRWMPDQEGQARTRKPEVKR